MSDVGYVPESAPEIEEEDAQQLGFWAKTELDKVADSFNETSFSRLSVLNAEPAKPRNGMIVYADGTNWNPGGTGEGFYGRVAGAWAKL